MQSLPTFEFEKELWVKGLKIIAGADEVGRGALAGPVVAAVVVFGIDERINVLIHDSKQLTQKQREVADIWIKKNAHYWGIGSANPSEINKLGIVKATNKAFRRAIKNSGIKLDFLLVDAFYIPKIKNLPKRKQLPIIKGDGKSISIAAASIIAKVYRDELMRNLATNSKYKKYRWDKNKGYGTLMHRTVIKKEGITKLHRVSFLLKLS